MLNAADITVLICSHNAGTARTLRMALRGMGLRGVHLAAGVNQTLSAFASAIPQAVIVHVDGPSETDEGMAMIRFLRQSAQSPNRYVPIVAVSPQRDLATINAVVNSGGHEYVLFPASGDGLLKKIAAACSSNRPFVDKADYFGPERRIDRDSKPETERRANAEVAVEPGVKAAG